MSLKDNIFNDIKEAMRARDKTRLSTLRLITSAIKQIEVDERRELNNDDIIAVLTRMIKQRKDSIGQYTTGNRSDLADKEQAEINIIQTYLPEQLTDDEINAMIKQAIADTGAESMKDMGKVMGKLKTQLQGRADMGQVSTKIKARLS